MTVLIPSGQSQEAKLSFSLPGVLELFDVPLIDDALDKTTHDLFILLDSVGQCTWPFDASSRAVVDVVAHIGKWRFL